MKSPVLKCGCIPNGTRTFPKPETPICITHNCTEVATEIPDLTGRQAKCCDLCGEIRPSSFDLPFFTYRADRDLDTWYNGYVHGWD